MAKKTTPKKDGQLPDVLDLIKGFDKEVDTVANTESAQIEEYISSGSRILDACLCGHICDNYGKDGKLTTCGSGWPKAKLLLIGGAPGSGKTFLACSFLKDAQKKGYSCIILDSENSIDQGFLERLGLDPNKVIIKKVSTIAEVISFMTKLCDALIDQKEKYGYCQPTIVSIDSASNLSSEKEIDDAVNMTGKKDFTKQQSNRQFARILLTKCANAGVTTIVLSHTYQSMDPYAGNGGQIISGGQGLQYAASVTLTLSVSKLVDKANDAAGEKVVGKENRLKNGILVTARPSKSRYTIPHKVQFPISFYRPMDSMKNVGLESYLTWENAGVAKGTMMSQKDFDKLSDADKQKVESWELNGEQYHAVLKDTARGIVVKHLGRTVSPVEFFGDEVFNEEFLRQIDRDVFRPTFELPSADSWDDVKEIQDLIGGDTEDESE